MKEGHFKGYEAITKSGRKQDHKIKKKRKQQNRGNICNE